jgi:type IV pilus assembly protein PilO
MAPPAAGGSALAKVSMPIRLLLGVGGFLIVAFAYWLVFYSDVSNKIEAEKKRKDALNASLAQAEQAKASYLADKDQLGILEEHQRDFNKVLPGDKQQAAFLSSIQQALNTAGVEMIAFSPVEEQPQAFYVKDPMRLEVSGKFHQVTKFFSEVSKLDRIINMENIELVDPRVNGDDITLRGRCLATAFHTLAPKAPAPGAPGAPPAPGAPK